jgi:hypothetical protein
MFNVEATIVQALNERKGISKTSGNPWVSREYLGEYADGDKRIRFVFTVFGDQIGPLVVGRSYVLNLKIEGREWQGKWFNNVLALQVYTSSMGGEQVAQEERQRPIEPKPDATLDAQGKLHTIKPSQKKEDASADDIPF